MSDATDEYLPRQESTLQKKHRRKILLFSGVSLLNVGLLALLLTQLLTPAPHAMTDPLIGHAAPGFTLPQSQSPTQKLSLSNFMGKPVVLIFWASWCDPCKQEEPILESAWKQMQTQGKDVVFLGINFQDSTSNATSFLQQYGITYPNVVDANGSVANAYGITSLPDTFFI
ncbi:MAG TPA: TlpA disulfide reductase family protein, partial [Ktedonobacteraceae bacterium]|nr:TlpA disulfide reductase family protein [Ktedonobacteraceae bacterium]